VSTAACSTSRGLWREKRRHTLPLSGPRRTPLGSNNTSSPRAVAPSRGDRGCGPSSSRSKRPFSGVRVVTFSPLGGLSATAWRRSLREPLAAHYFIPLEGLSKASSSCVSGALCSAAKPRCVRTQRTPLRGVKRPLLERSFGASLSRPQGTPNTRHLMIKLILFGSLQVSIGALVCGHSRRLSLELFLQGFKRGYWGL
jgi:hypothetical protein